MSDDRVKVQVQGAELRSVLRLESVEYDESDVECIATNEFGKDSSKAKLFIHEPDKGER